KSASSPTGRDSGLKSRTVPVRIRRGAPYAPCPEGPHDGEASGFQTPLAGGKEGWPTLSWDKATSAALLLVRVFESPLGCHAPQHQVASGRVATSVCAVRFRGGAPSSSNAEEWTSC